MPAPASAIAPASVPITTRLRRAYFAAACDQAARYGLSYERMLTHLWQARRFNSRLRLSTVKHVDDVVHVAACLDQNPLAWLDVIELHEPALIRVCRRRMTAPEAIMFVRKLWTELRLQSRQPALEGLPSLQSFDGQAPLRSWLVDRALGRLGARRNRTGHSGRSIIKAEPSNLKSLPSSQQVAMHPFPLSDPA